MTELFGIQSPHENVGYANLRNAEYRAEVEIRDRLQAMWQRFEPVADPDFRQSFAVDPDAGFWEMHLACTLLDRGKSLKDFAFRAQRGGAPDICVEDANGKLIWIEAISPNEGNGGDDQVRHPVPINLGGGLARAPVREAQLRLTSAFFTKSRKIASYRRKGTIGDGDASIIAIGLTRFGHLVSDEPLPLIVRALLPLGDQYVTIDRESGEVIEEGIRIEHQIERGAGDIPRNAFIDPQFEHVTGVIYSRATIGSLGMRPVTFLHNPLAKYPIERQWTAWDNEFVVEEAEDGYLLSELD